MLHEPPSTLWQLAACSRALPSPGLIANIPLLTLTLPLTASSPAIRHASAYSPLRPLSHCLASAAIALALPTYSGTLRDKANSARPKGLERYEDVSPEGMSSSVVVTGSYIAAASLITALSAKAGMSGQSLILGPYSRGVPSGLSQPLYTLPA